MLQVGSDDEGQAFCKSLEGLTTRGAKFDIVHTILFPQLKARGLANVLADCIKDEMTARIVRAREGKSKGDLSKDGSIQDIRNEQAQLEKRILSK